MYLAVFPSRNFVQEEEPQKTPSLITDLWTLQPPFKKGICGAVELPKVFVLPYQVPDCPRPLVHQFSDVAVCPWEFPLVVCRAEPMHALANRIQNEVSVGLAVLTKYIPMNRLWLIKSSCIKSADNSLVVSSASKRRVLVMFREFTLYQNELRSGLG